MARVDIPSGFIYDQKTRGAYNPSTHERLSRRQVEKARIARESGTSGSFEAKAKKAALLGPPVRLPRRLKVHHKPVGGGPGARTELAGQTRYRVRTFPEVVGVISSLPAGAVVYIKMLARSRLVKYKGKRVTSPLVWVSLSTLFRAEGIMRELPLITQKRADYFDIRAYDIIVKEIKP